MKEKWYQEAMDAIEDLHKQDKGALLVADMRDHIGGDLQRRRFTAQLTELSSHPVSEAGDQWIVVF